MTIETDDEDNRIILKHVYEANKDLPVHEKVAMNVNIHRIRTEDKMTMMQFTVVRPIYDENSGVTEERVTIDDTELGSKGEVAIEGFMDPIRSSLFAALREIKIRKLGI